MTLPAPVPSVRPPPNTLRALMRSKSGFAGLCVFVLIALVGPLFTPDVLPTNTSAIY